MIGLMYLKGLLLIRQMHRKNVMSVTIGIFKILVWNMNPICAMVENAKNYEF